MDIEICKINTSTLLEIRGRILGLAALVDEMIVLNERAVSEAVFVSRVQIEPISTGEKRIPVAKQVRRLLQLSGKNGTTVEEIVHLLSKKQPIVPQTVRCALRRCRVEGTARSVRRRWYAVVESNG